MKREFKNCINQTKRKKKCSHRLDLARIEKTKHEPRIKQESNEKWINQLPLVLVNSYMLI